MIKAIVFDCFGVLASDGWLPFRDSHFSSDPDKFDKVIAINKDVDAGIIKYDDFIAQVADLAGVSDSDARKDIENNIPDAELFEYINSNLKPSYKIGMLSNAADDWLDEIFTPDQVELFDAVALSFEIGAIKPDERAYQTITSRLGVDISECIFIDDQPKYCEGAVKAGMQAVLYKNVEQMKPLLSKLLG